MTWEERLDDLFADLEQQAEGLALALRDAEVAELARAEYAQVELVSRLHASVGHTVEVTTCGLGAVRGRLAQVGTGWCLVVPDEYSAGHPAGRLTHSDQERLLSLAAVLSVRGLAPGGRLPQARELTARLGLGSVLRRLAEERDPVVVTRIDGHHRRGLVCRVGADFLELAVDDAGLETVPFTAVAGFRRG